MTARRRLLLAIAGAAAGRGLLAGARAVPACTGQFLERTNYRGRPVSLVAGPVLALAASATAAVGSRDPRLSRAALLVGLTTGAFGAYDDIAGARPAHQGDKGFRGHLSAAAQGRISSGVVKAAGIGTASLIAARSITSRPADILLTAGVIAGTANLVNLLDLRPGRALKVTLLLGLPLLPGPAGPMLAGPLGSAAAVLPDDLAEHTMLGDAGANAIGAIVGLGLAASTGRAGRAAILALLVALTATSERTSFTGVIERTPGLREIDALGRCRAPFAA